MTQITTLFFDVGGVCLTNGWDHISREQAARHFSYDYDESEEHHQSIAEDFECGRLSIEDYVKKVVFFKQRSFTAEDFMGFMKSQSKPHESSLQVLETLSQQKKYSLATVNNESLALNLYRIRTFHLDRYFTAFFSSCFMGVKKPECEIFQKALWITQRKGEECLFIDDREENIAAARTCGLQAVYLPDPKALEKTLQEKGILL